MSSSWHERKAILGSNPVSIHLKKTFFLILTAFGISLQSEAGVGTSLSQTADVRRVGEFEITLQNDIIFNAHGGLNISPHLRMGVVEHFMDLDLFFGTGKTDFQIGALTKYNLLPDIPGQAALAFVGGVTYLNSYSVTDCKNCVLFTTGALVSKAFQTSFGHLAPYAAFQPEFLVGGDGSAFTMTLVGGAQWRIQEANPWHFYSELGASLRYAHWYLALGAGFPF